MRKQRAVVVSMICFFMMGMVSAGFKTTESIVEAEEIIEETSEEMADVSEDTVVPALKQRFPGVVEPQKTLEVKNNGKKVKKLYVKEGDQVKIGDKLFEYDNIDTEEKILTAQLEIDRLTNSIKTSNTQIETLKKEKQKLTNEDSILETTNRILTLENKQKKDEYELKRQSLTLEQLKNSLDHSTVISELDGVIKKINFNLMKGEEEGSSFSPDEDNTAFITIMATGNYRIKSSVGDKYKMLISEGLPVTVYSRVNENQTWQGTLSALDLGEDQKGGGKRESTPGSDNQGDRYTFYVNLSSAEDLILGQHVYIILDQESGEE